MFLNCDSYCQIAVYNLQFHHNECERYPHISAREFSSQLVGYKVILTLMLINEIAWYINFQVWVFALGIHFWDFVLVVA